jgi:hypothetical protein
MVGNYFVGVVVVARPDNGSILKMRRECMNNATPFFLASRDCFSNKYHIGAHNLQ